MAEQRRLLVARDPRDRDRMSVQCIRARRRDDARARAHARQRLLGDAEQIQQLLVPAAGCDVEEQRARGVRRVGHVLAAELEAQPRVDRPEDRAAVHRALAQPLDVLEQPRDLRRREVRVEHEARAFADERLVSFGSQPLAHVRRAAVLPHDRVVQRLASVGIPHAHRLALVGDPHSLKLARAHACVRERLTRDGLGDCPDLRGVVLDPPRPREVLRELAVRAAERLAAACEHEARRARRPLIDCEDHRAGEGT